MLSKTLLALILVSVLACAESTGYVTDRYEDVEPIAGPAPSPISLGEWVGIPAPSFGIDEVTDDSTFTHWIDNSVACSDSGNGTPSNPRCTIPNTFAAGSIVQLRGGPYSEMVVNFNGTASNPVFFRGATGTQVSLPGRNGIDVSGSYFIIENVDANRIKAISPSYGAFRDSYFHDVNTGGLIGIGGNNLVFLRVEVTRNGTIPSAKDRHGFNIYGSAFNIWILDSHIHHNSGDAIQFCHACVRARNGGPGAIYIANNVMHSDEENALDFKEFTGPVIVSGNEMYDYQPLGFSGSGEAVRINDEGHQGEVWFIRNNIHNNRVGMNPDDSRATSYAVDNVLTNNRVGIIRGFTGQANNWINGVSDRRDPEELYARFQRKYGIDIRPKAQ